VSGLSAPTCSGRCADGALCTGGATTPAGVPCPAGQYCLAGLGTPCPPGTFNPTPGASAPGACQACPAGTYNALAGAPAGEACIACDGFEGSDAGASVCWPGIRAILALDEEPLVPGLSADDVLTVYWTKATNRPDVSTTARVLALLSFAPPLASFMFATWQAGGDAAVPEAAERLVVTLAGTVNPDIAATRVTQVRGALRCRCCCCCCCWGRYIVCSSC
jgi:hypothetical protein